VNLKKKHKNNSEYCKAFGLHLRTLIEAKGYGLREFALNADVEYSSLSKIVRGVTNPTISTVQHLAESLGVAHYELFDFKFPQPNRKGK
jgi:transcriptional regulator with XRE-family HTH domain